MVPIFFYSGYAWPLDFKKEVALPSVTVPSLSLHPIRHPIMPDHHHREVLHRCEIHACEVIPIGSTSTDRIAFS